MLVGDVCSAHVICVLRKLSQVRMMLARNCLHNELCPHFHLTYHYLNSTIIVAVKAVLLYVPLTAVCILQAVDARKLEKGWRQRAEMAEAALEQARIDTADIRADMARQHNSTQVRLAAAHVPQGCQQYYWPIRLMPDSCTAAAHYAAA
jgi:hypothetical protein